MLPACWVGQAQRGGIEELQELAQRGLQDRNLSARRRIAANKEMNNIEQLDFHIFRIFRIFHVFHSKHFDVCELGGSHNRQEALPQGELQRRAAATEAAVLRGSSGEGNWQVMASDGKWITQKGKYIT